MKYKVLVTGGAGFLGKHICDKLSKNNYEVVIYDRNPPKEIIENQRFVEGDLLDRDKIDKEISKVDYIFHLGAIADIDVCKHDPYKTMEVNILGTINVLEAARKYSIKKILFASSIYVYSKSGSFYRISKHACESLLEEYQERYKLDYIILRFGTLYGTHSDEHNSVYRYLSQALKNKEISISGTGEEIREYIHADDAAHICLKLLDDKYKNDNFILTGHHRMNILDLLKMINEILGGNIAIKHSQEAKQAHYSQTPYSYTPKMGKKIISSTHNDIGQSLIEILEEIDIHQNIEINL